MPDTTNTSSSSADRPVATSTGASSGLQHGHGSSPVPGPRDDRSHDGEAGRDRTHGEHSRPGRGHAHGHGGGAHGREHGHGQDGDLATMLDLDARVVAPVLARVVEQVVAATSRPATRAVDLGAGTGVGTVALARLLPGAEVVAVDRAPDMLERTLARARAAGVADRVRALEADLAEGWPDTGPAGLVWASSSLHELPDPAAVVRGAAAVLTPGGSLAVVEMDTLPRFLPDDLGRGRPGLETRCHDLLARAGWNAYQDWTPYLEAVGLDVSRHRHELREQPPRELVTGYARAWLGRIRPYLQGRLPEDDLAVLDVLLGSGPESLERRDDLVLRASRTLWLGRRP